ncbi:MAG: major capsid protein, partial [Pseudomonadota bacterium]
MPFIVNEEHVASGIVERVNLNINLFGEQSAGAISIDRAGYRGDNPSVVSAQALDDLISDRDPTSTAAAAFTGIDQQEQVAAASYKRMGPKKVNLSDIQRSLNLGPTASPEATWLAYGNAIGEQLFKNYVLT